MSGDPAETQIPFDRREITSYGLILFLLMATAQTNGPQLPDIDFFRDLGLAYSERSGNNWPTTTLTTVHAKMKVLLIHPRSLSRQRFLVLINLDRPISLHQSTNRAALTEGDPSSYQDAADFLNFSNVDLVSLQLAAGLENGMCEHRQRA